MPEILGKTAKKTLPLIALSFAIAAPGTARENCNSSEWRRLEVMFEQAAKKEVSQVVWMRSNEQATLTACDVYEDGFIVKGRHNFSGFWNEETFWIEANACFYPNGASCGIEVTNMNGALLADLSAKAVFVGALGAFACANNPDCGN